jgi:hypothetical protein
MNFSRRNPIACLRRQPLSQCLRFDSARRQCVHAAAFVASACAAVGDANCLPKCTAAAVAYALIACGLRPCCAYHLSSAASSMPPICLCCPAVVNASIAIHMNSSSSLRCQLQLCCGSHLSSAASSMPPIWLYTNRLDSSTAREKICVLYWAVC